jgi:hypothetical protein
VVVHHEGAVFADGAVVGEMRLGLLALLAPSFRLRLRGLQILQILYMVTFILDLSELENGVTSCALLQ